MKKETKFFCQQKEYSHILPGHCKKRLFFMMIFLVEGMLPGRIFAQVITPSQDSRFQKSAENIIGKITYHPLSTREGKDLRIPVPPAEHPRLFLTKKDIPLLREKMTSPLLKDCWNRIVQASVFETDGNLPPGGKGNFDLKVRNAIEAKALMFVMTGDEIQGKSAVAAMLNFYSTLKIDMTIADVTRDVGRAIVTGAMVYDWCYPLLTLTEKQVLIGRMETLGTQLEIKWPVIGQSSITGHGTEAQLLRDMLSCGVATYDEKPVIYDFAAGRIMAEFAPARKFFYPGAYHNQGSSYGPFRFSCDMFATFIFDKIGYPSIFGPDQAKVPYYFIYSRRPDGQLFRNGDDFNELLTPFGRYWNSGSTSNSYSGSYFKDPILYHEALKEFPLGRDNDYLFDFLICDGNFTSDLTKTSLPFTRYFQEPFGAMIARTGWEEGLYAATVVAEMKIGVYDFANHQHLDAGSFQLYYKGPLTVESGIYVGNNGAYGSEHFKNYSQRTIAHNSLLIYDPNEQFTWQGKPIANDGGQQYPNGGNESKNLEDFLSHDYKTGEVLAHAFGPDAMSPEFSYLKGDLARAYPGKVKTCRRSFVFLHLTSAISKAVLIVYDNIATNGKDFKMTWLLHSVEEPVIEGNHTTITRTEKGYSGKMINTTLLPEKSDLHIDKVGGSGNEFSIMGTNYPQAIINRRGGNSADSAMWRVEISPEKPAASTGFLNVMQVMDNGVNPEPVTGIPEKIETEKFTGVKIEDRIVMFSKKGELISDNIHLIIKGSGSYKVLITDVKQGDWTIKTADNTSAAPDIKNKDQLLYFTINPGDYVISKK